MQNAKKTSLTLAIIILTAHCSTHAMLHIPRTLTRQVVHSGRQQPARAISAATEIDRCDESEQHVMPSRRYMQKRTYYDPNKGPSWSFGMAHSRSHPLSQLYPPEMGPALLAQALAEDKEESRRHSSSDEDHRTYTTRRLMRGTSRSHARALARSRKQTRARPITIELPPTQTALVCAEPPQFDDKQSISETIRRKHDREAAEMNVAIAALIAVGYSMFGGENLLFPYMAATNMISAGAFALYPKNTIRRRIRNTAAAISATGCLASLGTIPITLYEAYQVPLAGACPLVLLAYVALAGGTGLVDALILGVNSSELRRKFKN